MKTILYFLLASVLPLLAVAYGCSPDKSGVQGDSLYSVAYINRISLTEPQKALALLDTAGQRGLMSDFDISRLRCLAYHNGLSDNKSALRYGLQAYRMPESRGCAEDFLHLVELIADDYYQNGDYSESVRFCTEGLKMAKDSLVAASEANLNVTLALNLLGMDCPDEAFKHLYEAVEVLDKESRKSTLYIAADDYIYALGMTINSLLDENRIDEALSLQPRFYEAMDRLRQKEHIPDGLIDTRLASEYAAFAYMYAMKGDEAKARELYGKLCEIPLAHTPEFSNLHVPYLLKAKRYADALRYLRQEKDQWQANADTVSYDYIETHLKYELEAYEAQGDLRSANALLKTIRTLSDTLRVRTRNEEALELAEIYKTSEQAMQIEKQSASILVRNVIIVSVVILIVLAVVFIIRILQYNRTIRTKNKAMVKTIDELMGYKDELFERKEEVIRLRERLRSVADHPSDVVPSDVRTDGNEDPDVEAAPSVKVGRVLFDRMDHEILSRRLFLNPDFSKKELMDQFGIPANKFSQLFKDCAGCTFSQYVQNCRLDYAVKLMRDNPQWNMEAIAREAQMSNGAFYHHFKKRYGMSPSNFRAEEASMSTEN